jgi:tetratricopeptide (TPR) repeat protein
VPGLCSRLAFQEYEMTDPTGDDVDDVAGLIELATQEAASGNHDHAEQLLLRSYGFLESQKQHADELKARVFHLLANSYRDRGKLHTARDFYEKASQVVEETLLHSSLTFFDDMYIQALCEGDHDLALRSQQDLGKILSASASKPQESTLRNLLRLAAIFWARSDYENADRVLREYLQQLLEFSAGATPEYVSALGYLGLIAFRMGRPQEAKSLYKEALALAEKLGNVQKEALAEMLNQLGVVLCSQYKHQEAQENCARAEELKMLPDDDTSSRLRSIADVYCARDCFAEASEYCHAAVDVVEMGAGSTQKESFCVILRRLGLFEDAEVLASSFCQPQNENL